MNRAIVTITAAFVVGFTGLGLAGAQQAHGATTAMPVIGHRGTETTATVTENSRAAIKAALTEGANGVEFDVRLTKDKQQIVMHDETLDRTTTCTGKVTSRTYADIRAHCRLRNGEPVPNVYELAWEFSKWDSRTDRMWTHVKFEPTSTQRAALMKAVDKYGLRASTVVLADEGEMLDAFRKWSGITRALIFNQADVNQGAEESWGAGYDYAVPYQTPVTAELVAQARKTGSKVYAVEDNPVTLAEARTLKLDGFLANDVAAAL